MIEIYKYKNKYKNGHGSFACPFLFLYNKYMVL